MADRGQCFETREIVENEVFVVEETKNWRLRDSLEVGINEVGKRYHIKGGLPVSSVDGRTYAIILFVEPR